MGILDPRRALTIDAEAQLRADVERTLERGWRQHDGDVDLVDAALSELDRLRALLQVAEEAITYALDRASADPTGLGRYLGPRMESFERLCKAESELTGEDHTTLRARRAR